MPDGASGNLFVRIDSITSLVAYRHARGLPDGVRDELAAVSRECRSLSDRDELAVAIAARWWPSRYVGDLTGGEWAKVYAALEPPR